MQSRQFFSQISDAGDESGVLPCPIGLILYKSNNKSYRFKALQGIAIYIFTALTTSGKSLADFLGSYGSTD